MHRGSSGMITSFSPELFLRIRDRTVLTAPIKGTAPRGVGDSGLAALRASTKDAAENVMIVDLIRNDLSRVCRPGTVAVQDLLTIQPHPGVWHLVSLSAVSSRRRRPWPTSSERHFHRGR